MPFLMRAKEREQSLRLLMETHRAPPPLLIGVLIIDGTIW